MFTFKDAYSAKFYFDRLRASNSLLFDSHYNICEAVIKNAYIVQRVLESVIQKKQLIILDLGSGNGHLSRLLCQLTDSICYGFDPKTNLSTRLRNYKLNFRNIINNKAGRVYASKMNHKKFFEKYGRKYDVIFDNCSVTHFNTTKNLDTNMGWSFMAENMQNYLVDGGKYICSTDICVGDKIKSEFCFENEILNLFTTNGWMVHSQNIINQPSEFTSLAKFFDDFLKFNLLRVPPLGAIDGQALGITGFVAEKNNI